MMISLTTIFALTSSSSMVVVGAFVIYPTLFTSLLCCSFDYIHREYTIVPMLNRRQRLPLTSLQKKMMMATTDTNSLNENEEHSTDENNDNNMNSGDDNNRRRKVRIQKEMEICNILKVKELKVELESIYGVSTSSFIEKSEFVRALAELRVDGVIPTPAPSTTTATTTKRTNTSSSSSSSSSTSSSSRGSTKDNDETRDTNKDPTYRDVTVTKLSSGNKSLLLDDGKVIDTRARK